MRAFFDGFTTLGQPLSMAAVLMRICVAVVIGAVIGIDREIKNRPAGMRTHVLVCVGAALVSLIESQTVADVVALGNASIGVSMGRITTSVVSGVGFLGAGTILVTKSHEIKGLTTAAGLWAVSIIGTAIGAGFYTGGTVCYAFILLAMNVLRLVDVRIQSRQKTATVYFELRSKLSIGQLVRLAREKDCTLSELELYADSGYGDNLVCGTFTLWAEGRTSLDDILRELSAVEGVIYLTRI